MSLLKESLKRISRRAKKFQKRNKLGLKHALLGVAVVLSIISTPGHPLASNIFADMTEYTPKFVLNSEVSVIKPTQVVITIVPGESVVQKTEREAALAKAAEEKAVALKKKSNTIRVYSDPSNFDVIYQKAGAEFGVDPTLLKAIHTIETGASGSTNRSNPSGATGPMQFLPSTFRRHAVDGNGDGVKDIGNVEDAVFSAASYLKACGYPDIKKALWGYNPSTRYFTKVISLARSFGMNI